MEKENKTEYNDERNTQIGKKKLLDFIDILMETKVTFLYLMPNFN